MEFGAGQAASPTEEATPLPVDPFGEPVRAGGAYVWRVSLGQAGTEAEAALAAAEAQVAALDQAVGGLPRRLDMARALAAQPGVVSFSVGATTPEERLADALRAARGPVDFSAPEARSPEGAGAVKGRLDRLIDVARNAARVETELGGRLVAVSTLTWLGDARTVLSAGMGADAVAAHARTVAVVARTRRARLGLVVRIARGAAALAGSLGTGPGALVAVYRFVRDVLDGLDEMHEAARAPQEGLASEQL